jgi:hypothetical protein
MNKIEECTIEWVNNAIKEILTNMEILIANKKEPHDSEQEAKNTEEFLKLFDQMNALQTEIDAKKEHPCF